MKQSIHISSLRVLFYNYTLHKVAALHIRQSDRQTYLSSLHSTAGVLYHWTWTHHWIWILVPASWFLNIAKNLLASCGLISFYFSSPCALFSLMCFFFYLKWVNSARCNSFSFLCGVRPKVKVTTKAMFTYTKNTRKIATCRKTEINTEINFKSICTHSK